MLKGGFIVGAKYGRGLASCRTEKGWSAPAGVFFTVTGGSVGFQIGGQAVDLVMLIMNKDGMKAPALEPVRPWARWDASVAGGSRGPARRRQNTELEDAGGSADLFSRARGLFAGVSLKRRRGEAGQGTARRDFYGHMVTFKSSLTGAHRKRRRRRILFLTVLAKWRRQLRSEFGLRSSGRSTFGSEL